MDLKIRRDGRLDAGQKLTKLLRAMARVAGADDHPRFHVQGGEQGRRPVPDVVVSPSRGQARSHRQEWRGAIERLNLALLVHAEHQRAIRRMQVQPDDIADFVDQQRIFRELERFGAMRVQRERLPDARHRRLTQAFVFGQVAGTPVNRVPRRRLERRGDRLFNLRIGDLPWSAGPRLIEQSCQPRRDEAPAPFPHGLDRHAELRRNGRVLRAKERAKTREILLERVQRPEASCGRCGERGVRPHSSP